MRRRRFPPAASRERRWRTSRRPAAPAEATPVPADASADARARPSAATPGPVEASRPTRLPSRPKGQPSSSRPARPSSRPAAVGMRREVYGFLPYWEVSDSDTRLNFDILTHLAYFSVGADADGEPEEARQRRLADDRVGRLDEREDDLDHQRRPREAQPGDAHPLGLRLDVRPGHRPEGAPGQLDGAPQPGPPGGCRRAGPRGRRDQPRLRAARLGVRGRVRGAGPDDPGRAQPGRPRLPPLVRHDGLPGQLPPGGRPRRGRGGRRLHHGLRLPDGQLELRRAPSIRSPGPPTTWRTPFGPTRHASPPRG